MSEETPEAKLRNQLSPLYNLADMLISIGAIHDLEHRKGLLKIAIETAEQAVANKDRIKELLLEIESKDKVVYCVEGMYSDGISSSMNLFSSLEKATGFACVYRLDDLEMINVQSKMLDNPDYEGKVLYTRDKNETERI